MGKGATSEAESISSELLMRGADVRSIFLLPLVARCLETIGVCNMANVLFYGML